MGKDVTWLSNGPPQGQCMERWSDCDGNPNGCCDGLTCRWRDGEGYNACLPNLNPTPAPVPAPPTRTPTYAPTVPIEPTISPAPTPESSLLSTDKAMDAWAVFQGLDYITHKNSADNYALVASGGAAGSGNLVVSESQAYGLLITGTILASWDTHANKVPNSSRSEVLKYFEGYYNFWKQMCKDSSNKSTNCQSGGNYCKDSNGGSSVCLPDWRHYKTGGSESTGPAPDADEDAIVGIILAVKAVENDANKPSWYNEARKWADASATAFVEFETDNSKADFRLVKLGSCWGGWEGQGNNPSYHSPRLLFFCACDGFASKAGKAALPGRRTAEPSALISILDSLRADTTSSLVAFMTFILLQLTIMLRSNQPSLSVAIFSWKNLSCFKFS